MKIVQMHMDLEVSRNRPISGPADFIAVRLAESPTGDIRLMEMICERENMQKALRRVEENKGVPGVDGMKTTQLRGYIRRNWRWIKLALLNGTYKPLPVLRAEIKKPGGGMRPLGIPAVIDRLIQQAVMQILQRIWDHTFSEYSYGFRPNRSQQMAISQARCYVEAGYTYVVDIDLSKFFDRVNHDRLMHRLTTRIRDKRVLKIIHAYLRSGVMVGDINEETVEGTPQGSPLSPLLANIVLDELDKELEKRGLRFVRYADDVAIYVRSQKAAERVKRSVSRFIASKLKLVVNEEKSKVTRPWQSKYLGFRITKFMGRIRIGVHEKSLRRFKCRVREITRRKRGRNLKCIVWELNQFLRGWSAYFRPGMSETLANELDHWVRRRLRAYVWKQWKKPKTRVRNLKARGVYHKWAMLAGNASKGEWRMSNNSSVGKALPDTYFTGYLGLGLIGQSCQ